MGYVASDKRYGNSGFFRRCGRSGPYPALTVGPVSPADTTR